MKKFIIFTLLLVFPFIVVATDDDEKKSEITKISYTGELYDQAKFTITGKHFDLCNTPSIQ